MWGLLTRNGGSEDVQSVPAKIELADSECFFGRFEHPVKTPDSKFTHSTQILLNCMFVSSTHFSISVSDERDSEAVYTIKDFSRNGTYVNGVLVGPNVQKPVKDGDVITLMYKNKVRLSYAFAAAKANSEKQATTFGNTTSAPKVKIESTPVPREDEESARYASMKSQADSAADALARQVAVLQEESKRSEQRIQQLSARVEASATELEKSNAKVVGLEKHVETLQKDKEDLSERLSSSEANASAVEARNCKLLEQIEDAKAELKDLRTKNTLLSEDLQAKTAQLESRNDLMQNSNKALAHENKKWAKLEKKYEDACERIREAEDYSKRVTTANHALQGVTADQEGTIARLRTKNNALVDLLAQGRAAVDAREAEVAVMHKNVAAAVQAMSTLMTENQAVVNRSAYFDAISNQLSTEALAASPLSDSQENTYAEGGSFNKKQLLHSPTSSQAGPPFSANTQASVFNRTPSAGNKQGANGGTGNGMDSISSYSREQERTSGVDGEQSNIAMDIAASGHSSSASEDSATHERPASLAGDKRKRGEDGADEELAPAGKMAASMSRSGSAVQPTLSAVDEAGSGEHSDRAGEGAGDSDGEEEEDLQRTQAQANFAHLFEDQSDDGSGSEDGGGSGDGEDEADENAGVAAATMVVQEEEDAMQMDTSAVPAQAASEPTSQPRAPAARASSAEPIDLMDDSDNEGDGAVHHAARASSAKEVVDLSAEAPKRSQSASKAQPGTHSQSQHSASVSHSNGSSAGAAVPPAAGARANGSSSSEQGQQHGSPSEMEL